MLTLDAMARGGIHDQVGGGFHRYSVDARWSVPHFEKMLYDNALLAPVYLHAYQLSGREDLLEACTRTLDYMARELRLPGGGFAASQDADSPAVREHSSSGRRRSCARCSERRTARSRARVFGVVDSGNFEHGSDGAVHAVSARPGGPCARSVDEPALRDSRRRHPRPPADGARFARCPGARRQGHHRMERARGHRLRRGGRGARQIATMSRSRRRARTSCSMHLVATESCIASGTVATRASSGSSMMRRISATHCSRSTRRRASRGTSRRHSAWVSASLQQYRDADGSYFDTADDAEPLIVRPRTIDDNPVSAGQSVAAALFCRMHAFTGDERWRERALEIVAPLATVVARAPLAVAGLAAAMELLSVRCARSRSSAIRPIPARASLLDVAARRFDPLACSPGEPPGRSAPRRRALWTARRRPTSAAASCAVRR